MLIFSEISLRGMRPTFVLSILPHGSIAGESAPACIFSLYVIVLPLNHFPLLSEVVKVYIRFRNE